ncbi:MAG: 4Fe-4S cluster-binding domain-containing protein [Archaeoglobaceae archaeon]
MNKIEIEGGSYYNYLSEGCRLCTRGSKLVFFLTGECIHSCYYCPISEERGGNDVIFANEREVIGFEEVQHELELMDAEGVAITGGEPLLKPERLLGYLQLFKGLNLHIHLYTTIIPEETFLMELSKYLDEIRFHPISLQNPQRFEKPITMAKDLGMEVGMEIPALEYSQDIVDLVNRQDIFLNVNEVEFSSTNYDKLADKGFSVGESYGDTKSGEVAHLYWENVNKFHYCTALFKDSVQFRRRLIRMAHNYPHFYQATEEGTLICGVIEGDLDKAKEILRQAGEDYKQIEDQIEVSVEFVEERGETLKWMGFNISVIERYPTWKRIVVEKQPL